MAQSLADTLVELRRQARISQDDLAEVAGVARGTIKAIEGGKLGQHPRTLALIADGLATDGAGHRDPERARAVYNRLMIAAGYCPPAPPAADFSLETAIAERARDPELAALMAVVLEKYRTTDADGRTYLVEALRRF